MLSLQVLPGWRFLLSVGLVVAVMFSGASIAAPDEGYRETGKPATVRGELMRVCALDQKGGAIEKWYVVGVEEEENGGAAGPSRTYDLHFGADKPQDLSTGAHITA